MPQLAKLEGIFSCTSRGAEWMCRHEAGRPQPPQLPTFSALLKRLSLSLVRRLRGIGGGEMQRVFALPSSWFCRSPRLIKHSSTSSTWSKLPRQTMQIRWWTLPNMPSAFECSSLREARQFGRLRARDCVDEQSLCCRCHTSVSTSSESRDHICWRDICLPILNCTWWLLDDLKIFLPFIQFGFALSKVARPETNQSQTLPKLGRPEVHNSGLLTSDCTTRNWINRF